MLIITCSDVAGLTGTLGTGPEEGCGPETLHEVEQLQREIS